MSLIAIHSNKLMAYLVLRRFAIKKVEKNFNNNRMVYFFDDTRAIHNAMTDFLSDRDFNSTANRLMEVFSNDSTGRYTTANA